MPVTDSQLQMRLEEAASLIAEADSVLITAGAGIGIDSGLPDFRGEHGFWRAYPGLGKRSLRFTEIANPQVFHAQPKLAWGFYGHRLRLYRQTMPHDGFRRFLEMAARMPHGAFVFTSNVDGQFQKAGFNTEHVAECHGSIHHLQCLDGCGQAIWPADAYEPTVDNEHCLLQSQLPVCPRCGGLARPNILMFGDWEWDDSRTRQQQIRLQAWLARAQRPVVVEIGAGTAIPTVRLFGEELDCPLIRINPAEAAVGLKRHIPLPAGAMQGMCGIADALERMKA